MVGPLSCLKSTGFSVFLGDHKQLLAVMKSDANKRDGSDVSLFERLMEQNIVPSIMLVVQHRMQPAIVEFPNDAYYGGFLQTLVRRRPLPRGFEWPSKLPIAFVNVAGVESGRCMNITEIEVIVQIVGDLLAAHDVHADELVVLTYYNEQVAALEDDFRAKRMRILVSSIDSFQGSEARIVILSCVRCNRKGFIGFLGDRRRLNVGMTRAREGLIIVGCQAM